MQHMYTWNPQQLTEAGFDIAVWKFLSSTCSISSTSFKSHFDVMSRWDFFSRYRFAIKKIEEKFGSFNYFYYLCIGNTEVPKTLLLEKKKNQTLWNTLIEKDS